MKPIEKLTPKEFLLTLIKQQVQPALGCTEIGIISYACAKASSLLPGKFASATVYTSPYVFRNDSRVGVPRLGRCGMKTIAAAGIILKNPDKKLSCLDDLTPETIEQAKKLGDADNPAINVEVDFKYSDILTTADNVVTFKLAVKAIAAQLWVNEKSIEEDIEPLLLKLWKIEKTPQWRILL